MASGLLTGEFDAERVERLASDDWRRSPDDIAEIDALP
jgi:hypothetical protein